MLAQRQEKIDNFLKRENFGSYVRTSLGGDASTRSYERLSANDGKTYLLMNQPPALESQPCLPMMSEEERLLAGWNATARLAAGRIEAFVALSTHLRSLGLSAPECLAADIDNGLLVIEDFGDGLFAHRLAQKSDDEALFYEAAIDVLGVLHAAPVPSKLMYDWPILSYDRLALKGGVDLFIEWFPKWVGRGVFSDDQLAAWHAFWEGIIATAQRSKPVLVHRDYHAENLMWLDGRKGVARVGLVDFQDALIGHQVWDLHSLLQDARRDVSPAREEACLAYYLANNKVLDEEAFLNDYAALAILNEMRILGVFARLVVRDHKPRYASFMPRMWGHVARNLKKPALSSLKEWLIDAGFDQELKGNFS